MASWMGLRQHVRSLSSSEQKLYRFSFFLRTIITQFDRNNVDLQHKVIHSGDLAEAKPRLFDKPHIDHDIPSKNRLFGSRKSHSATSESPLDSEKNKKKISGSVDPKEIAKFSAIADTWWDPKGMHRGLHAMNPTRISFIRAALCKHFGKENTGLQPLQGLRVIDVGCGGGLLCEPLARLGADVVGLDASEKNISVASVHAARDPMTSSIKYICATAEELVEKGDKFDAVFALEVIEHVADPRVFMKSIGDLCREGGAVCVSTLNRTSRSYALAIIAAEYLLRWLPPETHDWSRFVTPQEMALLMRYSGLKMEEIAGMIYNPVKDKWFLDEDLAVNYIAFSTKPKNSVEISS